MARRMRPPLTGGRLDRDGGTRLDEAALDAAWADPQARILRLRNGQVALSARSEVAAALELRPVTGARSAAAVYLGRLDGAPVFARDSDADPAREVAGSPAPTPSDHAADQEPAPAAGWAAPFEFGWLLSPGEGELLAAGLAVTAWRRSSGFSPRDGSHLTPAHGGWAAIDPHGGEHFPRTDPVVIVRVEHEGRILLGSNALWETGRFSLLAGFIDAGESAEDAVVREVFEESGAVVDRVRYVTSQPWPFPRSLMLGFHAHLATGADPDALQPDTTELSELRWFTRDELRDPPPGITLPMPMSIARWLLDQWVAEADEPSRG